MHTVAGSVFMDARVKPEHDDGGVVGMSPHATPEALDRRLRPLGADRLVRLPGQGQRPFGGEGFGGQKL